MISPFGTRCFPFPHLSLILLSIAKALCVIQPLYLVLQNKLVRSV